MKVVRKLGRAYCEHRAASMPERRWSTVGLGVVVAARNRSGQRVDNFMRTLRRQTMPPDMVDITLVDYGSEPDHAASLREACLDWRVRYVGYSVPSHLERRRGHALNVGLRQMPTWCRIALCTDIDMLFAPNLLEWVMRTQLAYPRALTLCQFMDLPEDAIGPDTDPVAEFERLHALGIWYDDGATGPCTAAPREWFHAIRGFDERLFGEDHDDADIHHRAKRDGLVDVWIHGQTTLLHQWHYRRYDPPSTPEQALDHVSYHRHDEPNRHIVATSETVVRNEGFEWGQLPADGLVIEPPERRR
ncbi:MAG: hypothetical protein HZB16_04275 [Armatimonadetes bacterium]|nr:hypothetical protein [Armatimonadota bacterium]